MSWKTLPDFPESRRVRFSGRETTAVEKDSVGREPGGCFALSPLITLESRGRLAATGLLQKMHRCDCPGLASAEADPTAFPESRTIARPGFTLLEMLLATVLATFLTGAILVMTTAISRDRARLSQKSDLRQPPANLLELLRQDLSNADHFAQADDGRRLILTGHGGLDVRTRTHNGRLARVVYEVRGKGADAVLFRVQRYLDDSLKPEIWTELAAEDVSTLYLIPQTPDALPVNPKPPEEAELSRQPIEYFVPTRAKLAIQRTGKAYEEEVWLR